MKENDIQEYSRTTTATLETKESAAVERWPLCGGRGLIWHLLFFPGVQHVIVKKRKNAYCSILIRNTFKIFINKTETEQKQRPTTRSTASVS